MKCLRWSWMLVICLWVAGSPSAQCFSARGLSRPWEKTRKKLQLSQKKKRSIRFYVNHVHENADDDATEKAIEDKKSKYHSQNKAEQQEIALTQSNEETETDSINRKDTDILDPSAHVISPASVVVTKAAPSNSTIAITYKSHMKEPTTENPAKAVPSIRSCLPDLIAMTRPSNLPGVVLFHMLGTYLALQGTTASIDIGFWSLLVKPGMIITLLALLLTSSTSMLVNDYYDFKLGLDTSKTFQPLASPDRLPLLVAKRFLSALYALALVCVTMVPGVPARMAVVMGLMLTFWYTQHLKPKTWLKNAVCASLIALSPLTSGVAAMSLVGATNMHMGQLIKVVAMLFVGILGREITMDINDVTDDAAHGVRTVPVVYGRKFASTVGLACSIGVAAFAMSGPLRESLLWNSSGMTVPFVRRLVLALVGSLWQLRRGWQIFQSGGEDTEIVSKAVDEGLLSVVLLLGSFV